MKTEAEKLKDRNKEIRNLLKIDLDMFSARFKKFGDLNDGILRHRDKVEAALNRIRKKKEKLHNRWRYISRAKTPVAWKKYHADEKILNDAEKKQMKIWDRLDKRAETARERLHKYCPDSRMKDMIGFLDQKQSRELFLIVQKMLKERLK